MITKENIKTGVKLKLLCSRGRILKGKGMRSAGTVITIKSVDTANSEFEDTDGHVYWICDLQDFDLVPSVLPTDRPLTYDETQMLQEGDVVNYGSDNRTVVGVNEYKISFKETNGTWSLNKEIKDTYGDIYFVSHGEVKEEKIQGKHFDKIVFDDFCARREDIWKTNTTTGYDYCSSHKKTEEALDTIFSKPKETIIDASKLGITSLEIRPKVTKSVSQILYGR